MSDHSIGNTVFHARLRASSKILFWLGLLLTVLGLAALVFPMVSTIVATFLAGYVFLIAGIFMLVGSFSIHGTGPFFGALLVSLLSIAAGAFLLVNPLAGVLALTIVVAVLFLFQGTFEIVFGLEMRPHRGWGWMLLSGIASVILALVITVGLPGTSVIALGIILGINFLTTGIGYLVVWGATRA